MASRCGIRRKTENEIAFLQTEIYLRDVQLRSEILTALDSLFRQRLKIGSQFCRCIHLRSSSATIPTLSRHTDKRNWQVASDEESDTRPQINAVRRRQYKCTLLEKQQRSVGWRCIGIPFPAAHPHDWSRHGMDDIGASRP